MTNYLIVPIEFPMNRKYDTSVVQINAKDMKELRKKVYGQMYKVVPGASREDWTYSTVLYVYGPMKKDGQRSKKATIIKASRNGTLSWLPMSGGVAGKIQNDGSVRRL